MKNKKKSVNYLNKKQLVNNLINQNKIDFILALSNSKFQ